MSEITRPIGDVFEYNGSLYRVEKEISGCRGCAFNGNDYCSQAHSVRGGVCIKENIRR